MTSKRTRKPIKKFVLLAAFAAFTTGFATAEMGLQSSVAEAQGNRQFGTKAGTLVNDSQELSRQGRHNEAINKLNEALGVSELSAYERSIVQQSLAMEYISLEQYGPALSSLNNAINAGGLLPKEISDMQMTMAQLNFKAGNYGEGARILENIVNSDPSQNTLKNIELIVGARLETSDYRAARPWAEKMFNRAPQPKERKYFDIMNAIYTELGMKGRQADIVKEMIGRWTDDRQLWNVWLSLLSEGGREKEAFEVNKMLYLGGLLNTEDEISKMVDYYSYYDQPFQAARILEKEINAGRISKSADRLEELSDLYRQAREYKRAIPILEDAAKLSGKPKLYSALGEALYNEGQCEKAETALREAINRGADKGESWMFIANCRYEDAQKAPREVCEGTTVQQRREGVKNTKRLHAREAFLKVPASSRQKENARSWIQFIEAEYRAVEDRCEFLKNVEKEACFLDIQLAYGAMTVKGEFIMSEPEKCGRYKDAYDAEYRIGG